MQDKILQRKQALLGILRNLTKMPELFNQEDAFEDIRAGKATIKKGDKQSSKPVKELQTVLMDAGYELPRYGADGVFGIETEAAVKKYQEDKGLPITGIFNSLMAQRLAPNPVPPIAPAQKPTTSAKPAPAPHQGRDVSPLATQVGIEPEFLQAVLSIESSGNPSAIRFEPNVFNRYMEKAKLSDRVPFTKAQGYTYSKEITETNKAAFDRAFAINPEYAVKSTSWGLGQVMGVMLINLYPDPSQAVQAFYTDPQGVSEQLIVEWFRNTPSAIKAAQKLDFAGFARIYNGPQYKQHAYDEKLKAAYNKIKRQKPIYRS